MAKKGNGEAAETAIPESPIMSAGEVGKLIRLHESQVRRWAHAQIIPHYKSGSHIIFHRAEVMRWWAQGRRQEETPRSEEQEAAATLPPGLGGLPDLGLLLLDGEVELVVTVRRRTRK